MKAKMTKNLENIKVKLSVKEAEDLWNEIYELLNIDDFLSNENVRYFMELLEKTKPIINNDAI